MIESHLTPWDDSISATRVYPHPWSIRCSIWGYRHDLAALKRLSRTGISYIYSHMQIFPIAATEKYIYSEPPRPYASSFDVNHVRFGSTMLHFLDYKRQHPIWPHSVSFISSGLLDMPRPLNVTAWSAATSFGPWLSHNLNLNPSFEELPVLD
jgi:hypothetical protein